MRLEKRQDLLARLWGHLPLRRKRQFFLLLCLMLAGALAEVATLGAVLPFLAMIADPRQVTQYPGVGQLVGWFGLAEADDLLLALTLVFAAVAVGAGAVRILLAWASNTYAFRLGHELGTQVYDRVLHQPYGYHVSRNSGEVQAAIHKVQLVIGSVVVPLIQALSSILIGSSIVAILVMVEPLIAPLAVIGFGLLYLGVSISTRRILSLHSQTMARAQSRRIQAIQEGLGGIRDVLLDGSQSVFLKRFRDLDRAFREAQAASNVIGTAPRFAIESMGMVVIASLAYLLTRGEEGLVGALPVLGALALGAQRLLPLMHIIFQGWTRVASSWHALADVLDLLDAPMDHYEPVPAQAPLTFEREIAFRNVSFSYLRGEMPALVNLDFAIPKGTRVGIVGKTGSGKSTTVDLLMGLLAPTRGRIKIDGRRLDDTTRRAWQRQIAHVPQAIFLADASIAENIAFGVAARNIEHDRVREAATQAALSSFIEGLPDGYDTLVGEGGVRLSGGQRQRIGIARALYKKAPVLVFDEATSALDSETEAAMMAAFARSSAHGRTIIIIAHRPTTLHGCDLILRLSSGRLVGAERKDDPAQQPLARCE